MDVFDGPVVPTYRSLVSEALLDTTQNFVDARLLVLAGIRALESLDALAETGGWEMRIECLVWPPIDAMLGAVDVQTFP